ncbi:MAG: DUF1800 domain-containing protein [Saprospiraceae bacterium]|nr:DUF1800 domain-containing protein [Saprospiraceae bacterium]
MTERQIIHLNNRLGFGISEKALDQFSFQEFIKQLHTSQAYQEEMTFGDLEDLNLRSFRMGNREEILKSTREYMSKMRSAWMGQMIHSPYPALEKINLFWHHHFACEIKNPVFARAYSNMIRKNSLGNFRDLLKGVSQSAAMIAYLNLRQNKKGSPNEDFARELCELFTLGFNTDYTEDDVKEIARAFTGWSHNFDGSFRLRRRLHDKGSKSIFGQQGNYDGNEVIDLILEKRSCATFIARNVYEYFVSANHIESHIEELGEVLYNSDYDLRKMFIHLVEASWFYNEEHIMSRIKSPIEFLVSMGRQFNLNHEDERAWSYLQKALDQTLYRPPNVAGWKVNRQWINSNSLTLRLRLPSVLLADGFIEMNLRPELDEMIKAKVKGNKGFKLLKSFNSDWDLFFQNNPGGNYKLTLLNNSISPQASKALAKLGSQGDQEKVIQLMSLPEYQLS